MLRYYNYDIVFSEIPDETTLAINISGCPNRCPDCHSKFLWDDVGEKLEFKTIYNLIDKYPTITCVAFMGGDQDLRYLKACIEQVKRKYPNLKTAWYSGKSEIPEYFEYDYEYKPFDGQLNWVFVDWDHIWIKENCYQGKYDLTMFDYIKLGPYIEEFGPLNNPNTNQRLYKVEKNQLVDITYKFWK